MGSSFVGLGPFGFWCNDGHLQLLMHLLAEEIERSEASEPWLIEARDYWRDQCWLEAVGHFSPDFQRFAATSDQALRLHRIARRVHAGIQDRRTPLSEILSRESRRGRTRTFVGDVPKEWFLQVTEAATRLLDGTLKTTASTSPVFPRLPLYQEWSAVDHDRAMIFQFWVHLEREQFRPEPGESAIDRLLIPPWESKDRRLQAAWELLTRPEHLPALELWYQPDDMNRMAREYTEAALRACRARQS